MSEPERFRTIRRTIPLATAVLVSAFSVGCTQRPEAYPVHGRLEYEGQPMAGALVIFHPVDPEQKTLAMARADENGDYSLQTSGIDAGVLPGDYAVTVTWEEFATPGTEESPNNPGTGTDRLKLVYAEAASTPLKATVERKDNVADFRLP